MMIFLLNMGIFSRQFCHCLGISKNNLLFYIHSGNQKILKLTKAA